MDGSRARTGGRPWHSDLLFAPFAPAVGKDGSSVVSDRLDIVRLIDARVTSTRRTVTRSKQLTEAAKGDLHIHEDWLRQHNERFGHDLKRQQGSIKRRERIENNKRFAKTALLFLPRLGAGLCRGVVSGFRKADDVFLAGCAWLGRTAYAFGRSLIGVLGGAGASAGSQALRLGLMLAAAFWLILSWLGKCARALALASMRASLRGFSWLGPKASSFGRSLTASVSLGLSQFATGIGGVSLEAGGGVKRQASNLIAIASKGDGARTQASSGPRPEPPTTSSLHPAARRARPASKAHSRHGPPLRAASFASRSRRCERMGRATKACP